MRRLVTSEPGALVQVGAAESPGEHRHVVIPQRRRDLGHVPVAHDAPYGKPEDMRVLALGGAGGMGRHACRAAIGLNGIDELVITDLDGTRAARFAVQLGPGVRSLGLDVTDGAALDAALAQADVVMNTAGPFFRFGAPVLAAALRAGCHYLDICDDWEPTLQMLDLHEQAARRGLTAIIGMGASPGITNLLAVVAARELGSPGQIVTGWNLDGAQPERAAGAGPSAALAHGIRQMTGTIRVFRDGHPAEETPLRRVSIDYPGLGAARSWTFGHPEPVTLPRVFGDLVSSVNVCHGSRPTLAMFTLMKWLVDHRALSTGRAVATAAWAERHLPPPRPAKIFSPARLPPLFGYAAGLRRGSPAAVGVALCRLPGTTMGAVTGIPLAVALGLLLNGAVGQHGVFTPEQVLDPGQFFAALAPFCPSQPAARDMIAVTRSWDPGARAQFRSAMLAARAAASVSQDTAGREARA